MNRDEIIAAAKKKAFFQDWNNVSVHDATGFQDGWDKGWNGAIKHAAAETARADKAEAELNELRQATGALDDPA